MMRGGSVILSALLAAVCVACTAAPSADADVETPESANAVVEQVLYLEGDDNRRIALSLYYRTGGCDQCTLILFSHGARSAPGFYPVLLKEWARAGFVVAGPLHVDSSEHAGRDDVAPARYLALRIEDMEKALDALLGAERKDIDVSLNGAYVAAGHSFGGLVAQVIGGAHPHEKSGAKPATVSTRPETIIAISPPPGIPDYMDADGWSKVGSPMLVITGTKDVLPGFVEEWETHLDSYNAAPASFSYGAIFNDIDHFFNGAFGRTSTEPQEGKTPAVERLNEMILTFMQNTMAADRLSADQWIAQSDEIATTLSRVGEVENNDER